MSDTRTRDSGEPVAEAVLLDLFRKMVTIAAADRRAQSEASKGALKAAYYPVQGLEAVCAALGTVVTPADHLVSTYRNLADALAKGVPLERILLELYGREGGTSKGKGGPMHLVDVGNGLMMTTGIVGSGLPVAAGLALAAQLDGDGRVVVVTFGDGATSIGAFHETLNLAALWALPIVFVCQNNGWGEHTALDEYTVQPELHRRAHAYGMTGEAVDGFDPLAVRRTLAAAVGRARGGEGPTLVECITYRLTPHVATAEMSYMPSDRLSAAVARDPIAALRSVLVERGIATSSEIEAIEQAASADVDQAFAAAEAGSPPPSSEFYRDVFEQEAMVPGR